MKSLNTFDPFVAAVLSNAMAGISSINSRAGEYPAFGKKKPASPSPVTDDEVAMTKLRDDVAQVISQFQQSTGRNVNTAFVAFDKDTEVGCAHACVAVFSWPIVRSMFDTLESESKNHVLDDILKQIL
jgi:hypothetical protein